MQTVVLAAGYGTRLYPLTQDTPKALLPMGSSTILGQLAGKMEKPGTGISHVCLVSNHKFAEPFRQWAALQKGTLSWTVLDDKTSSEADRLGSIGDLVFAIREQKIDDDLLVFGSDNLFEADFAGFVKFAKEKNQVTLAAVELPDKSSASRYGVLTVGEDRRITEFSEKPVQPKSAWISTAVYFFPRRTVSRVVEYLSSQKTADTLGAFIAWMIAREPVYAYPLNGTWFDIGDLESYRSAQKIFGGG